MRECRVVRHYKNSENYKYSINPVIINIETGKPIGYVIYPKFHDCERPGWVSRLFHGIKRGDEWWCDCGKGFYWMEDLGWWEKTNI